MKLRKINVQDAFAQWEYTTALPADENGLTNQYHGVSYEDYIETVLPTLISYEHPVNMPDWFVPESYYYLWDNDCLIGEFRIRHHLTEALREGAGHIASQKVILKNGAYIAGEDETHLFMRIPK